MSNTILRISKIYFSFYLYFFILLTLSYSQRDTLINAKTLTGTSDSLIVADSTIQISKPKIKFWKLKPLSFENKFLFFGKSKSDIDFSDYKFAGNLVSYFQYGFLIDLGYLGAPSFINLFSFSNNNSSLVFDGIEINNRWNSFSDFNILQVEDISSVEVLPPTQSFLWNISNLPITIKTESKDSISNKPLTRIRYYQAQDNEAFIDANFSAKLFSDFAFSFRLTNSTTDGNFANSNSGVWKATLKTIYSISDSFNAKITFSHLKSDVNLFGGIDVESISNLYSDSKSVLYNSSLALVNFRDQNETTLRNNIKLTFYGNILKNIYSDFNIYYESFQQTFNRSLNQTTNDSLFISNKNNYEIINIASYNAFDKNNLSAIFQFQYENVNFKIDNLQYYNRVSNYSAFLLTKYKLLNELITPQVYGKYLNSNSKNFYGYGLDLQFNITPRVKLTTGFSTFEKPFSILEYKYLPINLNEKKEKFSNLFLSSEYVSHNFKASLSFFNIKSDNSPLPIFSEKNVKLNSTKLIFNNTDSYNNRGMNLNTEFKVWVLSALFNLNYYFKTAEVLSTFAYKYSLLSGFYYTNTLFNSNLKLKTGFNFYYNSNIHSSIIDFQSKRNSNLFLENGTLSEFSFINLSNPNLKLDFILIGRIQDRANFYFVFENLLGQSYYILPYYPMYERGIRIGISWDFIN